MPRRNTDLAGAVLDALDSGLAVLDRDERVIAWNEWLCSATGITARDAVGKTLIELFPHISGSRLTSAVQAAMEFGSSTLLSHALHPALLPLRTRAGRPLLHNVAVRPVGLTSRLGCLIQVADVTLATERETVLRLRQNARYEAVVGTAPDPILTFDDQALVQLANPAAEHEFGYSVQELIGRPLNTLLENAELWESQWRAVLDGKAVSWPLELVVRRKDGSFSFIDASASRWMSNSRMFVTAILRNVNARRAAEAALVRSNETLEERVRERTLDLERAHEQLRHSQKMEAIGQLTGGVAHDFNNLLTPILGGLDILHRRGASDPRAARIIDGALQSAERAQTLVQRLLAFARRQPLRASAVDTADLVRNMADLFGGTMGPRVRLITDVPDDLPSVRADPNQLEMAILNLAVNGRDAMPDGGTLTISADRHEVGDIVGLVPGSYVRLSVSDTGIGMDPATLSRAVEPFFSTKGIGKGTGLGLSMIHGLAAQLGGLLDLSSTPGVGTTVSIWLPVAGPETEAAPSSVRGEGDAQQGAGTVLLVDDEDLVRKATSHMLADLGYAVIEASSADQALGCLDDPRITVIVTDHLMPGMTGTELAREARARGHLAPFLIISGYSELDQVAPDLARLMKPFREFELSAALQALKRGGSVVLKGHS
jgi:PAS domain S-box-containing protein